MKVLVDINDGNEIRTMGGQYIGVLPADVMVFEHDGSTESTLESTPDSAAVQLAALGYTADDIVKLKYAGAL